MNVKEDKSKRKKAPKEKVFTNLLKKNKPNEDILTRKIPDQIESFIPESKLYNQLVEYEKSIDASLLARKLEVQDALRVKPNRTLHTLRICISNTCQNQGGFYHTDAALQGSLAQEPSWTLRIEGKIIDEMRPSNRKFTSYFRHVFVQLNKQQHPEDDLVEWHRTAHTVDTDCFEVKRKGTADTKLKLIFDLNHQPPQYKLAPALSNLLNIKMEARARIIMALWQYIKYNHLQDPHDRKTVINNQPLKDIFKCDKMTFGQIPQLITPHLSAPASIEIEHIVKVSDQPGHDEEGHPFDESERYYDIPIHLEDYTIETQSVESSSRQMTAIDDQIHRLMLELNARKQRREFMLHFAEDPVNFIHNLVASQIRDIKIAQSRTGKDDEQQRHSMFYYQPYVAEAVQQFSHSVVLPQSSGDPSNLQPFISAVPPQQLQQQYAAHAAMNQQYQQ